MPVDGHRVSGSRNCREPIARLRDTGARLNNEAHFPYGLCDRLLCWSYHDILARISSKDRRAKHECEHNAYTYFHAVIVSPLSIFRKLNRGELRTNPP